MDHFEMVEKLREKANVSYEDAKNALEASQWDLLDALVYLEQEGKVPEEQVGSYSTRQEPREKPAATDHNSKGAFRRLFDFVAKVINGMNKVSMEVRRKGQVAFTLPLLALVLLVLFCFWFIIPVMVLGLFFGYTYRFQGHSAADSVNRAMDKAADVANTIKTGVSDADNTAD